MERHHLLALGGGIALLGGVVLAKLLRAPAEDGGGGGTDNPCESTSPPGPQPPVPAGWSLYRGPVSSTATSQASAALALPMGSTATFVDDDGSSLGLLVMWHCHDPSSGMKPVGWHKGATLFRIG